MASGLVNTKLVASEALSCPDQQQHDESCNSLSVFSESGKLDVDIADEKNAQSSGNVEKFRVDTHKFSMEEASKAGLNANTEEERSFEGQIEQASSATSPQCDGNLSDIAELHMKVGQTNENAGLDKDEEIKDKHAQDSSSKEHSAASIPSGIPGSFTKCETSSKHTNTHKDPKKRSEHEETKSESKSRHANHVQSSEKIVAERDSHSNPEKAKAHKHSRASSSSHHSSSKVDKKSESAEHKKPSSRGHGSESRHHHHGDSHRASKQKIDSTEDEGDKKLKEEGSSDRKQSHAAAKPSKHNHAKEKASSEAASTCRKRKLSDSPSGESSSGDATRNPTALQEKRAKMLALIDERKSELKKSVPDDESADVATSSKGEKEGFQFPASAHPDLIASSKLVYEPIGLICTSKFAKEPESGEYAACTFSLNKRQIRFRVAKTTPTKNGQFVTFWKRIGKGPIMPYDAKDPVDLLVVCVRDGKNFGQFVFPKSTLIAEDVMSRSGKGGKRAIRVYAPWVKAESTQAMNSQSWQAKHFLNMSDKNKLDLQRARRLYAA